MAGSIYKCMRAEMRQKRQARCRQADCFSKARRKAPSDAPEARIAPASERTHCRALRRARVRARWRRRGARPAGPARSRLHSARAATRSARTAAGRESGRGWRALACVCWRRGGGVDGGGRATSVNDRCWPAAIQVPTRRASWQAGQLGKDISADLSRLTAAMQTNPHC